MIQPNLMNSIQRNPGMVLHYGATLFIWLCILLNASPALSMISGPAYISDGDSLRIDGQRIRLFGIDAPELKQTCLNLSQQPYPCGLIAKNVMISMTQNTKVTCKIIGRDRYKRIIAECYAGDKDLAKHMVEQGWALAYRRYSNKYVQEENEAKQKKLGLFQGSFTPPWTFRRQN